MISFPHRKIGRISFCFTLLVLSASCKDEPKAKPFLLSNNDHADQVLKGELSYLVGDWISTDSGKTQYLYVSSTPRHYSLQQWNYTIATGQTCSFRIGGTSIAFVNKEFADDPGSQYTVTAAFDSISLLGDSDSLEHCKTFSSKKVADVGGATTTSGQITFGLTKISDTSISMRGLTFNKLSPTLNSPVSYTVPSPCTVLFNGRFMDDWGTTHLLKQSDCSSMNWTRLPSSGTPPSSPDSEESTAVSQTFTADGKEYRTTHDDWVVYRYTRTFYVGSKLVFATRTLYSASGAPEIYRVQTLEWNVGLTVATLNDYSSVAESEYQSGAPAGAITRTVTYTKQ